MKQAVKLLALIALFLVLQGAGNPVSAQCAMCRAVAESGHENSDRNVGAGLNSGILYLLSVPYLIGGAAFWVWHRNRKKA